MGKHLNPLEKEVLIRQFKGNDKVKLYEFCKANNISMNSFRTWARKYEAGGLEALARLDNTLPEFPLSVGQQKWAHVDSWAQR